MCSRRMVLVSFGVHEHMSKAMKYIRYHCILTRFLAEIPGKNFLVPGHLFDNIGNI